MVWWDFCMILFLVAGVLFDCCSVLWMMDVSVVSLDDAVLTGLVVEWAAYVSDGSPWWWATNRKNKDRSSMLEFYWIINRFYMHLSLYYITKALKIIKKFYAVFCRHRPCYLTDAMNPEMSHLSLWQLSRTKMNLTVGCYWRHSLTVSHVTWWWYFGEEWTYSESAGS